MSNAKTKYTTKYLTFSHKSKQCPFYSFIPHGIKTITILTFFTPNFTLILPTIFNKKLREITTDSQFTTKQRMFKAKNLPQLVCVDDFLVNPDLRLEPSSV